MKNNFLDDLTSYIDKISNRSRLIFFRNVECFRVNLLTVGHLNKIQSNYAGAFVFIENFIERME